MSNFHQPVLLDEVTGYLNIKKDCWYIDATLGGGGHARAILEKGGKVLGIDQDQAALDEIKKQLVQFINQGNLIPVHHNFSHLEQIVIQNKIKPEGILFDLGVSSHQLDTSGRGFSFQSDAPLDMRMDQTKNTATASDLVNGLYEKELKELFLKYGQERNAGKIARLIVETRKNKKIETTKQLADLISANFKRGRIHPATRTFQALRIAVNSELASLEDALPQAFEQLPQKGRIVVITFHSLEEEIIKKLFNSWQKNGHAKILTPTAITPSEQEVSKNPRSRSAKLWALKKI